MPFQHNLVLYDWGTIVGRLLLGDPRAQKVNGMYIEFCNSGTVSPPEPNRDEGRSYYDNLVLSADRDYLRVAIAASSLESSDTTLFPLGNLPRFFAVASGLSAGQGGKPFSDAAGSVVYGAALVVMPQENDASQDLILSRVYFDTADQQAKLATSQIGVDWEIGLL